MSPDRTARSLHPVASSAIGAESPGLINATWVNLNDPGIKGVTISDSVTDNQLVGIVLGVNSPEFSYQAAVKAKG